MKAQSRSILAVALTGIWVNASEFLRNEILLKTYWVEHYQMLGMTFPSEAKNGMLWVVWGFLFAIAIYFISRRFNVIQATLLCWFMAFVLMWIVTFNLNILPGDILVYAIPLSLLETCIGCYICIKMSPNMDDQTLQSAR